MSEPKRVTAGVYALRYAYRTESVRGEHFYGHDEHCADPYPIDYFVWAMCRDDDVVMVDTGFTRDTALRRGKRPYLAEPAELLGMLGRSADEVSVLVLSHLHYDHSGNIDAFPNATVQVQRAEIEFWNTPIADRGDYPHLVERPDLTLVDRLIADGRVVLGEGDVTVDARVTLHHVGGHTPGQQVVRIETDDGPVVLATDASHFYENLEHDRPYSIVDSLPAMYAAFDRLRDLAGPDGVIVPGHDPRVRERHAPVPGLDGLVTHLRPGPG